MLLITAAGLLVVAGLLVPPWWRSRRRRALRTQPLPAAWRAILHRIPLYARAPDALRPQLDGLVQVFLAEKNFIGCQGQAIDDEVRLTIAAQACLLLLHRPTGVFPKARDILVYPSAFVVERIRPEPSGVLQDTREVLSGESWTHGQVILSWQDVLDGAADPSDGRNVVLHEFAHQLDQEKGYANGAPVRPFRDVSPTWPGVLAREYARLQADAAWGQPTLINTYGATAPAEFFAVATETFFERPAEMAALHPDLYRELSALYRVDPQKWGQTPLIHTAT